MRDVTLGIIGGQGRMGTWFKNQFEETGLTVLVADKDTPLSARDLCERCEVVIVSVPIIVSEEVIAEVGPYMPEDSLLMDLTSNKTGPVEAMLRHSRSEVVGAHPLFGPREDSIKGRHVVLCPGRGEKWLRWLTRLLQDMGAIIKVITPDHHDRLMAVVQGLTHLSTLALALAIQDSQLDPQDLDTFSTTSFRHLKPQIIRTLRQDADLIAPIMMLNPKVLEAVEAWEARVSALKQMVKKGDASECADLIRQARNSMGVPSEAQELRELSTARNSTKLRKRG
ncbi:MAG: prephenate dehydrogenase/arogenate dehydrogenase family protein [Deltaproteobacteria bacterium]|nr:prephenate dehydrogenase/arogenate dehydrogenase family protein [Deltaproteobacteria bacterium]